MNLKQINNLKKVKDMAVRGKDKIDKRIATNNENAKVQIEKADSNVADSLDRIFDILRDDFVDFCDTFMYLKENAPKELTKILNVINNLTSVNELRCICKLDVDADGVPYLALVYKGNIIFKVTYPEGYDYPGDGVTYIRTTKLGQFIVDDNSPFWWEVKYTENDNLCVYYRDKMVDNVEDCIIEFDAIGNVLKDVITTLFEEVEKEDIE